MELVRELKEFLLDGVFGLMEFLPEIGQSVVGEGRGAGESGRRRRRPHFPRRRRNHGLLPHLHGRLYNNLLDFRFPRDQCKKKIMLQGTKREERLLVIDCVQCQANRGGLYHTSLYHPDPVSIQAFRALNPIQQREI